MAPNMNLKEGIEVVFTREMKSLDKGTVGILKTLHEEWCVIVYPQNTSYEEDGQGGWKLIKNAPNKVYAHSAKLTEIKIA